MTDRIEETFPVPSRREFFDSLAPEWEERGFSAQEQAQIQRMKERLGDLRGKTVFEPGCGTGRMTRLLAEWVGSGGRVIAVDESEQMIEAAGRAVRSLTRDGHGRVDLHRVRAEDFLVPERSIDLVLLFGVFPHFEDRSLALRRFAPILRDDGRLVVAHLMGRERLNALHADAGEAVKMDQIPPPASLAEMFEGAGLRIQEVVDREEEFFLDAVPLR